jgi:hypothetical protein
MAVLGLAAIEAEIDAAVREAIDEEVPAELVNARFGVKLALAVGMGLLPSRYRPLFDRLATIRNRLAHGEIHRLTRQHANMLSDAIDVTFSRIAEQRHEERRVLMRESEPIVSLRLGLAAARELFHNMTAIARERREEQRQAVIERATTRAQRQAIIDALREVVGGED